MSGGVNFGSYVSLPGQVSESRQMEPDFSSQPKSAMGESDKFKYPPGPTLQHEQEDLIQEVRSGATHSHFPLRTPYKAASSETSPHAHGVRKRSLPAPVPSMDGVNSKKRVAKCLFGSPPPETTVKVEARTAVKCLFGPPSDEQNRLVTQAVETKLQQEYENFNRRFIIVPD